MTSPSTPRRKCLRCNAAVAVGIILCERCLEAINEARASRDIGPRFEKERWLGMRPFFLLFGLGVSVILMVHLARFSFLYADFSRPSLRTFAFFYPAVVTFILYFLLGVVLGRGISRKLTRCWAEEQFYDRTMSNLQRLRYIGFFSHLARIVLSFLAVFFICRAVPIGVDAFLRLISHNETLHLFPRLERQLAYTAINGFGSGLSLALYFYTSWIERLDK